MSEDDMESFRQHAHKFGDPKRELRRLLVALRHFCQY